MATPVTTVETIATQLADALKQLVCARFASLTAEELLSVVESARRPRVVANGAAQRANGAAPATAPAPKRQRSRKRRSRGGASAQSAQLLESIVGALKGAKDGMRSEELQKALGVKDISRALTSGLAAKAIRKRGEKRATTYYAG